MTVAAAADYSKALSQEQIGEFWEKGFVKIGKLLDDELLEELRREYDRIFAAARQDGHFRNLAIDDTDDVDTKIEANEPRPCTTRRRIRPSGSGGPLSSTS